MRPLDISQTRLAEEIGVAVDRIRDLIDGKCGITAESALRLAKYFGTSPELWLRLQMEYDLYLARRDAWPEIDKKVGCFGASDDRAAPEKSSGDLHDGAVRAAKATVIALRPAPRIVDPDPATPPAADATPAVSDTDDEQMPSDDGPIPQLAPDGEPADATIEGCDDDRPDAADEDDSLDIPDPADLKFRTAP